MGGVGVKGNHVQIVVTPQHVSKKARMNTRIIGNKDPDHEFHSTRPDENQPIGALLSVKEWPKQLQFGEGRNFKREQAEDTLVYLGVQAPFTLRLQPDA